MPEALQWGQRPRHTRTSPTLEEGFLIRQPGSYLPAVLEAIQGWREAAGGAVGVV